MSLTKEEIRKMEEKITDPMTRAVVDFMSNQKETPVKRASKIKLPVDRFNQYVEFVSRLNRFPKGTMPTSLQLQFAHIKVEKGDSQEIVVE